MTIYNHKFRKKTARTVDIEWDDETLERLGQELDNIAEYRSTGKKKELIHLVTGRKYNSRRRKSYYDKHYHNVLRDTPDDHPAKPLLEYFQTVPLKPYTTNFQNNATHARKLIETLPEEKNLEKKRVRCLKLLKKIGVNPKPAFRTSLKGNTVRIFENNGHAYLALKRDVRKALTRDWIEYDLKSAQLAIVAKLWNLPIITDFLRNGKDIWMEIGETLDIVDKEKSNPNTHFKDVKSDIKAALYAIIFGISNNNLEAMIYDSQLEELCMHATEQYKKRSQYTGNL